MKAVRRALGLLATAVLIGAAGCGGGSSAHDGGGDHPASDGGGSDGRQDGSDASLVDSHVDSAQDSMPQNCAQAGCAPFQLCDLQASGDAGICQPGCQPGFDWNATTQTCTQVGGSCGTAADSIAAACTAVNRTCQEANGSAMCGGCVTGFVESGSSCVAVTTCADCAGRHRDCAQSGGVPSCGACSAGFQETIGGTCAAVQTSCQDGGVDGGGCSYCPSGQGWDPFAGACHACLDGVPQKCDGPGETGNVVITDSKDNVRCICETRAGFYPDSASNAAQPCDNDGDGWVRESAQPAYESTNAVIHLNARCNVLTVDRIELQGESGTVDEVALAAPLPLYESNRNDGATTSGADIVPPYGTMPLSPVTLNSFTKACVTTTADHNHNGLADVSEWATAGSASGAFRSAVAANPKLMTYYQQYSRFSYFVELNNGAYEPIAGATAGRYRITERSRQSGADPSVAVSLAAPSGTSPYWRSCGRHVDSLYRASTTHSFAGGGDFADLQSMGVPEVMVHESQFKCVTVKSATDYAQGGFDASTNPEVVSVKNGTEVDRKSGSATVVLPWTPNTCTLTSEQAVPGAVPPSLAELSCSVVALTDVVADHAYWMVVGYENATNTVPADYVRGCLNECVEVIPDPGPCNRCDTDNAGHGTVSVRPSGTTCPAGVCDGAGTCGVCVPGSVQCKDATTPQSCSAARVWVDQPACSFGCNAGACYAQCTPNSRQCSGTTTPQNCDATGHWVSEAACATGFGCVGAGMCQCIDDTYGKACNAATSIGTIGPGASMQVTGVLPLTTSENWFQVTFSSGGSHPKITISATDMISFDVTSGTCSGGHPMCMDTSAPATRLAVWEVSTTGGSASGVGCGSSTLTCNSTCNCTTPYAPTPSVGTLLVRVYRPTGSPTCNAYTLTVSN
jgi:hypothetical protein